MACAACLRIKALPPVLQTARLWLRPLKLADAEQAQLLFPQWDIVRLLAAGVPWPFPPDGVHQYYQHVALPAMERGDEWHWTLRLKTAPEQLIGAISLIKTGVTNRGFWLGKPWHGQGLMSEACDAVTDYWFSSLGFDKMRVVKAAANIASRRISEKQGMRLVETAEIAYVSGTLPTEVWEMTTQEWRSRRNMLS